MTCLVWWMATLFFGTYLLFIPIALWLAMKTLRYSQSRIWGYLEETSIPKSTKWITIFPVELARTLIYPSCFSRRKTSFGAKSSTLFGASEPQEWEVLAHSHPASLDCKRLRSTSGHMLCVFIVILTFTTYIYIYTHTSICNVLTWQWNINTRITGRLSN